MDHDDLSITERVLEKALSRILMGSDHPYFCFYGRGEAFGSVVIIYRITEENKNFVFIVANAIVKEPLLNIRETQNWVDQFVTSNELRYDVYTVDKAYKDFITRVRRQEQK